MSALAQPASQIPRRTPAFVNVKIDRDALWAVQMLNSFSSGDLIRPF
jgi:hypothetical protein